MYVNVLYSIFLSGKSCALLPFVCVACPQRDKAVACVRAYQANHMRRGDEICVWQVTPSAAELNGRHGGMPAETHVSRRHWPSFHTVRRIIRTSRATMRRVQTLHCKAREQLRSLWAVVCFVKYSWPLCGRFRPYAEIAPVADRSPSSCL